MHSSFFDFELAWWREYEKNKEQILWVTFEDLIRAPKREIERCSKFLGYSLSPKQIDDIAEAISFKKMKSMAAKDEKEKGGKGISSVLMNKGIVGRWKKVLSEKQSNRLDRIVRNRFFGTGLEFYFGCECDYQCKTCKGALGISE